MIKYLVVGLGNIGPEYCKTRHNTGFMVVDRFAEKNNAPAWEDRRYGFINRVNIKGRQIVLLKPSTFMNLSGNAVRYWMKEENIALENLLIVVDDLALPIGELRLKPKGSDAGHNGLKHIADILGTQSYARLRFGIGNEYPRGGQVDFVLGKFDDEDLRNDINKARAYAKDLVDEFFKSLKETSKAAAKGACDGAYGYIIGGIFATIVFALIRACH